MCFPALVAALPAAFGGTAAAGAAAVSTGTVVANYAMLASTVLTGVSAYQQGQAAKATGQFNKRQLENQAIEVRNKANDEENKQRRLTAELVSKQRAQIGASGVNVNRDTPLQLQTDTQLLGEADALRIRQGFDSKAKSLNDQGRLVEYEGDSLATAGNIKAASSLLSGAGQIMGGGVADRWYTPRSSAASE